MKNFIKLFSFISILTFISSCENNDDSDTKTISYEEAIKESENTSKILNDLNKNFFTTNSTINFDTLNFNTNPWDNREIFEVKGVRYRTKNPANKYGYYSFVFKPTIAKKYGIPPGIYWCEFWTISARADLPENTLAARALDTNPKGFLAFEPHNDKEEFGVRYSITKNGNYQTITMSTNYLFIAVNSTNFAVNRTIPSSSFRNDEFKFLYQYIEW